MFISIVILLAFVYFIWHNDELYKKSTERHAQADRWTTSQLKQAAEVSNGPKEAPLLNSRDLPPKTGRRYIIVGGIGFVGNWIVGTLLRRGEEPYNIRVVDLKPPSLPEQLEYLAAGVEYVKADITDRNATTASFMKTWTKPDAENVSKGLTVFHCAAVIRYFERHTTFLSRSMAVNMGGTRNVIEASKAAGADIFLYTSSTVVGARPARLLSFPWESKRSETCTQVVSDEGEAEGRGEVVWHYRMHDDFISNYAETKFQAELLVRNADKANGGKLRTGILRAGAILFGPTHLDPIFLGFLKSPYPNLLWCSNTVQHLLYIENCVSAHLLYEQRLLEAQHGSRDIGGHAYIVTDTPHNFANLTKALTILSNGKVKFLNISPTIMYLLSHLVEGYDLVYHHSPVLQKILPRLGGDLIKLQPSSHQSMLVNFFYDDSLIRAPVEKEGLGYRAKVSAFDAFCHTVMWLQKHTLDEKAA
ncbi:3beta-hydroxysteroid-dehydrogenase/decarboxylase isoform 2 [Leucoagaricus sp. SymC.cos]|nr:3beta-hydroxysteroid-dehydrogenase/decarboxylase isoform 2 [Leucoagaricus sp. SymC.cos]